MPPKPESPVLAASRRKRRVVGFGVALFLVIGYLVWSPLSQPPPAVFTDWAEEAQYFRDGKEGIVLHLSNHSDAYLVAHWEQEGFFDTFDMLRIEYVVKGGWFRSSSREVVYSEGESEVLARFPDGTKCYSTGMAQKKVVEVV